MLTALLTAAVFAFVGVRLVGAARYSAGREGRRRVAAIVGGIRWRHLWPVPFVLTGVVVTALALVQVPGLSFGWWTLLGGLGNPVTGTTSQTQGTSLEWIVPLVFLTLLAPALPLFAYREEEIFRRGAEHRSAWQRWARSVQFGLVHALIGIPIGVALALAIGGQYFTLAYLRGFRTSGGDEQEALMESARAHTAYNGVIVGIVLLALALGGLDS